MAMLRTSFFETGLDLLQCRAERIERPVREFEIFRPQERRSAVSLQRLQESKRFGRRLCVASRTPVTHATLDQWEECRTPAGFGSFVKQESFVSWFREAWPYIQGHRSSLFVIVIPGEVIADTKKMDGVLQDILLLHGLGVKVVIVPGTQVQIDELLIQRGIQPEYEGAYRITCREALEASMEAAGKVRLLLEARLSRGTSIPSLRRFADNNRWDEVAVASGNYLAAKRRGVVNGVDFGSTGEVKRVDLQRMREDLDKDCVVLLSNIGYSSTGEVLNCNMYEVATACAIALKADKLLCLLDGTVLDDKGRLIRFMTLKEADKLIRERAGQSSAAADYVKAVAGTAYVKSLGLTVTSNTGRAQIDNGGNGSYRSSNGKVQIRNRCSSHGDGSAVSYMTEEKSDKGFAIGGFERFGRVYGYLSELTAAVFACRHGVGRVHLLDSNINGALLLELYSRDGVGNMVSSDTYEGTRRAISTDIESIQKLLTPFVEEGILVDRPWEQLRREIENYIILERDGSILACCALFPHDKEKSGEVAAFAVSPDCRGTGIGTTLLEYVERRAKDLEMKKLFVLTTRTADWFVQRGFKVGSVDLLPEKRRRTVDISRNSKYYEKSLDVDKK